MKQSKKRLVKNSQVVNQTVTAFLLSLPLTATTMAADTTSKADNSVKLDSINVTGERDKYNPEYSESNKFTAPLVDTPKTVNVIPQAIIKDTGSNTLQDALRNVSGITFGAAEGGNPMGDRPFIRGIDSQNSISVDGLRDIAAGSRETFNIEQIEVIKGADSAFNGRAGAGGSINITTKLPKTENFKRADFGLGTDNHFRTTVDVNQAFDNGVALRLNAMGLKEDVPGRDGPENKRWGVAPAITFGLGSPTRATFAWYHLETNDIPDSGIPYNIPATDPGAGTHTYHPTTGGDRNNWYGLKDRDFRDEKTDQLTSIIEHDLNDVMTVKNTFRVSQSKQQYILTQPDDSKGNVVNGEVWRRGNARNSETTTVQNATELTGALSTGFIDHTYTTGIELSRERADVRSTAIQVGSNTCASGIGAASGYTCTSLSDPNPGDPWLYGYTLPEPTHYETKTIAAYVFDTMELTPQWLINGGVRFDHYDTTVKNDTADLARMDNLWNYQTGVVFKPLPNGSIYANFATSSTPGGSFLGQGSESQGLTPGRGNTNLNGDELKPEKTRSYELGTKWNFFDNQLSTTFALFRNEVTNVRIADPNDPANSIMGGEKVVDGFEISATGRITTKWDVFAGYTFMDSEQKDIGVTTTGIGNAGSGEDFPNTPRHSFTLWSNYQITPKFNAGIGLYSQSDVVGGYSYYNRAAPNPDQLIVKGVSGYTRYDAMLNYKINQHLQAQLNLYNLTDKEYYTSAYASHYANIAAGRSAVATLKLDF